MSRISRSSPWRKRFENRNLKSNIVYLNRVCYCFLQIELASVLYDKGLVVTRQPMEMVSSSECESSEEATSSVENRAPVAASKKKKVRKQVSKRKIISSAANKSSNV